MSDQAEISKMLWEVIPTTIKVLRKELAAATKYQLTVPQIRVLACLNRASSDATALSEMQGVSLPAISKMIDVLVGRGLVQRQISDLDRRQAEISLTHQGRELFLKSRREAQTQLAPLITSLSSSRQKTLKAGLQILQELFG